MNLNDLMASLGLGGDDIREPASGPLVNIYPEMPMVVVGSHVRSIVQYQHIGKAIQASLNNNDKMPEDGAVTYNVSRAYPEEIAEFLREVTGVRFTDIQEWFASDEYVYKLSQEEVDAVHAKAIEEQNNG